MPCAVDWEGAEHMGPLTQALTQQPLHLGIHTASDYES